MTARSARLAVAPGREEHGKRMGFVDALQHFQPRGIIHAMFLIRMR